MASGVRQGAYVQYPNAAMTDTNYLRHAKRLVPPTPSGVQARRWWSNFVSWRYPDMWVATVVNPADKGGPVASLLFLFHLAVWVVAIGLTAAAGFRVETGDYQNEVNGVAVDFSDNTGMIGMMGGISGIIGVLGIVLSTMLYTTDTYRTATGTNTLITALLNYSLVSAFYIFCRAALIKTSGEFYYVTLFGVIFHTYAMMLFYSCSAALETLALPRAMVPTLALSFQWINYYEMKTATDTDGFFECVQPTTDAHFATTGPCNDTQQDLAMLVPGLTVSAVLVMIIGRKLVRGESGIKNAPFIRSLILSCFLAAAGITAYQYAVLAANVVHNIQRLFALISMLFSFAILGVVFMPSAKPSAIEAIEATEVRSVKVEEEPEPVAV